MVVINKKKQVVKQIKSTCLVSVGKRSLGYFLGVCTLMQIRQVSW